MRRKKEEKKEEKSGKVAGFSIICNGHGEGDKNNGEGERNKGNAQGDLFENEKLQKKNHSRVQMSSDSTHAVGLSPQKV